MTFLGGVRFKLLRNVRTHQQAAAAASSSNRRSQQQEQYRYRFSAAGKIETKVRNSIIFVIFYRFNYESKAVVETVSNNNANSTNVKNRWSIDDTKVTASAKMNSNNDSTNIETSTSVIASNNVKIGTNVGGST
jgi:hypothetical protein